MTPAELGRTAADLARRDYVKQSGVVSTLSPFLSKVMTRLGRTSSRAFSPLSPTGPYTPITPSSAATTQLPGKTPGLTAPGVRPAVWEPGTILGRRHVPTYAKPWGSPPAAPEMSMPKILGLAGGTAAAGVGVGAAAGALAK